MAQNYITTDNIFTLWKTTKAKTDRLTQPFQEYSRVAQNRPAETLDDAYPNVTDGTAASIIQKTPKRVVQQLPSGVVQSDNDNDWLSVVAQFIYENKIIPYANEDYSLFEKSQLIIEEGLTYGTGLSYAPFLNHDGEFGPDLTLPYWGDIYPQVGKKSIRSAKYIFIRSWWQKEDIEQLINSETRQSKNAKKRGDTYDPTWDVANLKEIKDALTAKDQKSQSEYDKEHQVNDTAIELVTAFQEGIEAPFYTFNPKMELIVRTKENKDPRGKMPLNVFYGDADGTNPFGRSIIELIGPLQNLIDSDMQAYQYNRALMLQPPVIKYGNVGNFTFAPNEVLDAQDDPNAKIVPLTIDTTAVANYPALYQLQQSQLFNLVQSPSSQISSSNGALSQGKTPTALNQQQATLSVDDNTIRKSWERWFEDWSETAINLYFAERTGVEILQLDSKTADKLHQLAQRGYFKEEMLNDKNQIILNYDEDTPALKFRVNPGTTTVSSSAEQMADATNLLDLAMKYPMLNSSYGGPLDIDALSRRIVMNSGIDNPELIAPEPSPDQIKAKEAAKDKPNMFSPMFDKPSIRVNFPDLPPAAQVQVLGMAGINVTVQDIMAGPVVDPNIRGVMNPVNDPSALLPGQQPGQAGASNASPIDIGDIYKATNDPTVKAEIEQMAGLHPNPQNVQDHVETNATQHMATQAGNLSQTADAIAPHEEQPAQQASAQPQQQVTPQQEAIDQQLATQLKHLGFDDNTISQAIQMLNSGASEQQTLQALGIGANHG